MRKSVTVITSDIRNSLAHASAYYIEYLEQQIKAAKQKIPEEEHWEGIGEQSWVEIATDLEQALSDVKKAKKWLEDISYVWSCEDQQK
jgi:DNA-binding transcriptional regulator GbsR (MarR family)